MTWVGIDGYYYNSASTFAPLFGPTIAAVRALTHDPILISETAVAPAAGQSAKIADLFAGIRLYGLLGFVWFDATHWFDAVLRTGASGARILRGAPAGRRDVLQASVMNDRLSGGRKAGCRAPRDHPNSRRWAMAQHERRS